MGKIGGLSGERTYEKLGEKQKGISDYAEVIREDPTFVQAHLSRGNLYKALGDNENAIAD